MLADVDAENWTFKSLTRWQYDSHVNDCESSRSARSSCRGEEHYSVQVFGANGDIGRYRLEIENFPCPCAFSRTAPSRRRQRPEQYRQCHRRGQPQNLDPSGPDGVRPRPDARRSPHHDLNGGTSRGRRDTGCRRGDICQWHHGRICRRRQGASTTLFQFTLLAGLLGSVPNLLPVNGGFLSQVTAAVRIFDDRRNAEAPRPPLRPERYSRRRFRSTGSIRTGRRVQASVLPDPRLICSIPSRWSHRRRSSIAYPSASATWSPAACLYSPCLGRSCYRSRTQ